MISFKRMIIKAKLVEDFNGYLENDYNWFMHLFANYFWIFICSIEKQWLLCCIQGVLLLLLLLLSRFRHVRLCTTPEMAAHQAPPSLGFSRQEHWNGLLFPSPMHESEKWKWNCSVLPDLAAPWTAAYQVPPSMGFSRQEYWSGLPLPSPKESTKGY